MWTFARVEKKQGTTARKEGAYQDLIEKILDELLVQGSRGQEAVQVRSKQFRDKVATWFREPDEKVQSE